MSPGDGLLLLAVLGGVAWWWSGLRAREAALQAAREATDREGLQWLDATVAGGRARLVRSASGRLHLERRFRFEFSDDGMRRLDGEVLMSGGQVRGVSLAPWRIESDPRNGPDRVVKTATSVEGSAPARVTPARWTVIRGGRHGRLHEED